MEYWDLEILVLLAVLLLNSELNTSLVAMQAALRSEFGDLAFEPHISVVGVISLAPDDALHRFRSACAAISRYLARVSTAAAATFFLFIDPSPEVIETKSHTCAHFGYENSMSYTPHLSLLFTDLPDEVKEKARQRVEELDKEIAGVTSCLQIPIGDKVAYALSKGLKVIACVGETLEQRESGATMEVVAAQRKLLPPLEQFCDTT
ncbi:cyclic phosphodiesterase-like [Curcuma longa]|uniref:cyclic phosphodiesterase-like n=1 Tax=Curcuma longa TaxID=136217 RepID=UPI003D9E3FB1